MWSRSRLWPATLAGQFLVLQLTVLLVVVAVASVVSVQQSDADFRDTRGARMRAEAERLANLEAVREPYLAGRVAEKRASLTSYTQQVQTNVQASGVYLADPDGVVLVSSDFSGRERRIDLTGSTVQQLRPWTGDVDDFGTRSIAAQVPIIDDDGDLAGIAMVAEQYPSWGERARSVLPDLLTFAGLGLALGVAGSFLLSRLIRRRTRGLEPAAIAALADQREALLHSIREGVFAVADDGTVTMMSDSARELIGLGDDVEGRRVADLDLDPALRGLLADDAEIRDHVVVLGERVLVVNRNPVVERGRRVASVTTLRDRTELLALQSELSARESITNTLRAQTHEFHNQLHTISGLVQLGEYDEVSRLVGTLSRRRAEISDAVTARVEDPAVAALLIAKTSLAAERRVGLVITSGSVLPRLDPEASTDVGTVLGNLVDNAVDASVSVGGTSVTVGVRLEGDTVHLSVSDTGPGVPAELVRGDLPAGLEHQVGVRGGPGCRTGARAGRLRASGRRRHRPPGRRRHRGRLRGATAGSGGRMSNRSDDVGVLVVDDDFMVARIHTQFVERTPGFRVVGVASSGQAALDDVSRLRPDLVLLDVHLPDMTGIDVLRRLRADGDDVGVLMVTAAREADTVRAAASGGAVHYLVKPFDYDDLRVRLESFRAAHLALSGTGAPGQQDIDAVFGAAVAPTTAAALPKGLSPETADAVLVALGDAGELSAAECADVVGISRVSARRYLEHFVARGSAAVRLQYGGAGRPERRYRRGS